MNANLKNVDTKIKLKERFNDRMQRGKDLAFFDKIKISEKFYKKQKINFIEFFYSIYSIYKWGLGMKLELQEALPLSVIDEMETMSSDQIIDLYNKTFGK